MSSVCSTDRRSELLCTFTLVSLEEGQLPTAQLPVLAPLDLGASRRTRAGELMREKSWSNGAPPRADAPVCGRLGVLSEAGQQP